MAAACYYAFLSHHPTPTTAQQAVIAPRFTTTAVLLYSSTVADCSQLRTFLPQHYVRQNQNQGRYEQNCSCCCYCCIPRQRLILPAVAPFFTAAAVFPKALLGSVQQFEATPVFCCPMQRRKRERQHLFFSFSLFRIYSSTAAAVCGSTLTCPYYARETVQVKQGEILRCIRHYRAVLLSVRTFHPKKLFGDVNTTAVQYRLYLIRVVFFF